MVVDEQICSARSIRNTIEGTDIAVKSRLNFYRQVVMVLLQIIQVVNIQNSTGNLLIT